MSDYTVRSLRDDKTALVDYLAMKTELSAEEQTALCDTWCSGIVKRAFDHVTPIYKSICDQHRAD